MIEIDQQSLDGLLQTLHTENEAIQTLLSQMAAKEGLYTGVDAEAEWQGMPEFDQQDLQPVRQIIVSFESPEDVAAFALLVEQPITAQTKSLWYPAQPHADRRQLVYSREGEA